MGASHHFSVQAHLAILNGAHGSRHGIEARDGCGMTPDTAP